MPFNQSEAYFEDCIEISDSISVFSFGCILTEIHIQFPMQVIFYAPVASDLCIECFGGIACAADVIAGLLLGFPCFLEVALRADPNDGFKVGPGFLKIQKAQFSDGITLPDLHPSVAGI